MNEENFEKYEQDYIKEHTTTIHGYTEEYVKKLQQENKTLKEQLLDETKNNYKLENELEKQRKEYQETYKDVREEIKDYKNQLKQQDEVIDETIEFCNYLLENNEVEIDSERYFKHSCDDIITNAILKKLQKYKGDNNE